MGPKTLMVKAPIVSCTLNSQSLKNLVSKKLKTSERMTTIAQDWQDSLKQARVRSAGLGMLRG